MLIQVAWYTYLVTGSRWRFLSDPDTVATFKAKLPTIDMTGSDKLQTNFTYLRAEARDRGELVGEPASVANFFNAIR